MTASSAVGSQWVMMLPATDTMYRHKATHGCHPIFALRMVGVPGEHDETNRTYHVRFMPQCQPICSATRFLIAAPRGFSVLPDLPLTVFRRALVTYWRMRVRRLYKSFLAWKRFRVPLRTVLIWDLHVCDSIKSIIRDFVCPHFCHVSHMCITTMAALARHMQVEARHRMHVYGGYSHLIVDFDATRPHH